MNNKYGLGSIKVATEHHEIHHKTPHKTMSLHTMQCRLCGSGQLVLSPTMHDRTCADCGHWQNDIPSGYSTGRSSDY